MTEHRRSVGQAADDDVLDGVVRHALVPFAVSRLVMLLVAGFANSYLLPWAISQDLEATGADLFLQPWNRFDSGFFLDVAQNGYGEAGTASWGVFPVYPFVVHVVAVVLGGSQTAFLIAALLVSNLAAAGAAALLYVLVRVEWGVDVARRCSLYFAFLPFGFYLAAPYADALFILLAVGTLLLVRQHRWLAAGAVGAVAAATRPPGALLALVVLAELVATWRERRHTGRRAPVVPAVAGAALVPAGLLAFAAYGWVATGDWWVTQTVSAEIWGRDVSDPVGGVRKLVDAAHWGDPASYLFSPVNLVLLVAVTAALVVALRRYPVTYGVFTAVLLAAAVSYGSLQSLGRQSTAMVPLLVLLAAFTRSTTSVRHQLVLAGFTAAGTVLLVCFVLNIPIVA